MKDLMETGKERVQPVITGTFPAQRFFDTLAAILSERENVKITVKVMLPDEEEPDTVEGETVEKQQEAAAV